MEKEENEIENEIIIFKMEKKRGNYEWRFKK
jgi:hypothetical protein